MWHKKTNTPWAVRFSCVENAY